LAPSQAGFLLLQTAQDDDAKDRFHRGFAPGVNGITQPFFQGRMVALATDRDQGRELNVPGTAPGQLS
jgi:hypothetical protein